jgi:hypothetical protein
MTPVLYGELQKKISEDLNARLREFRRIITEAGELFRGLGMETSVWCPEKIYTKNIGGITADSYVGYARIEGKWRLAIRTIERDSLNNMFISSRMYSIESCRNIELVIEALRKKDELLLAVSTSVDNQIKLLKTVSDSADPSGRIGITK